MESDEQNDFVSPMAGDLVEWTSFRQIDYLWLFDPIMKFRERQGLKLEESSIKADDYEHMRRINRRALADFLRAQSQMETDVVVDVDDDDQTWNDECIDEEIKQLLSLKENG